ncbi:ervatamin-C-like [Dioscorea cayenensis subsp. rotundata]|uniref:Ervatamin-C-like n=1 Tax=Dioscorea cayennensis subsp. rotundata TaxID=55577 RepID=A0AB40C2B0_DIOCR|nr:ervatamin-C-like [Dioscorea cayenensis subsp. rotundata]
MVSPLALLCISFLFIFPLSCSSSIPIRSEYEVSLLFEGWLVKLNKSYKDSSEKEKRYEIFKDNLRYIDEHNTRNHTFTLGLNVFADITVEEYRATYLGTMPPSHSLYMTTDENIEKDESDDRYFNMTNTPSSIDWRDLGAVTPVKNQGGCFSCWAFAVLATVEAINQIKTGNLISLSEQQLVDCHKKTCQGHQLHKTYEYIVSNGGVDTDKDYPYKANVTKCDTAKENKKVVSIDDYKMVTQQNEFALMEAAANQPVAVIVEAYERNFQLYKKGIFTTYCGTKVDHAVTIVGYDSTGGVDYWIIKNSWGDFWGEAGYLRLQRNIQDRAGKCGVAEWPYYPIKN